MRQLMDIAEYRADVERVSRADLPWEKLDGKTVAISGGSGMIGSFLADVLMLRVGRGELDAEVVAIGRNAARAKERFSRWWEHRSFRFLSQDINVAFELPGGRDTFVFHLASNTHPIAYATDPIGTITANIIGTQNMLGLVRGDGRFVFASSNEVYGENRGDAELFDESYCGYIDCNTLRAGYPESKRCGEALCQAYASQRGTDVAIARLTRTYGPSMLLSDTKAVSQFILKAVGGQDIVLKSEGTQFYSYTHVSDAVLGLLTIALCGASGEAYNIADVSSDITLRDLATCIAEAVGRKVVFELPDAVERAGYSTATKARLDGTKVRSLGWAPHYDIRTGIEATIRCIQEGQR